MNGSSPSPLNYQKIIMFRFNFHSEDIDHENVITDDKQDLAEEPCQEIVVSDSDRKYIFKSICLYNVTFFIRDLGSEKAEVNGEFMDSYKDCDVIPSVYEGGLKVWECTYDLLLFLMSHNVDFINKTILDLGCGCGLLGICAGLKGAKMIHFQDYNIDVLNDFTIPNVRKNEIKSTTKFFSGDWKNFCNSSYVKDIEYDYILTSETLYSTNNYTKLYQIFLSKLKNQGEIFVASKSYYFGVGGSVQQFQQLLNHNKSLYWENVWKTDNEEGVQREILCIKKSS